MARQKAAEAERAQAAERKSAPDALEVGDPQAEITALAESAKKRLGEEELLNERLSDALEEARQARRNADRQPSPSGRRGVAEPDAQLETLGSEANSVEVEQWITEEKGRLELEARLKALSEVAGGVLVDQEISLRVKGGTTVFHGLFKSFDGKNYVILSPDLGTLTVRADRFDCISTQCPVAAN